MAILAFRLITSSLRIPFRANWRLAKRLFTRLCQVNGMCRRYSRACYVHILLSNTTKFHALLIVSAETEASSVRLCRLLVTQTPEHARFLQLLQTTAKFDDSAKLKDSPCVFLYKIKWRPLSCMQLRKRHTCLWHTAMFEEHEAVG